MPWIKRKLRGKLVFVRTNEKGEPDTDERGLVEIVYKMATSSKIYNASQKNLIPTGEAEDEKPQQYDDAPPKGQSTPTEEKKTASTKSQTSTAQSTAAVGNFPNDAIVIYTDGACSGNPGPAGIGAVLMYDGERQEISEFLGEGTNNIAELTAIERALLAIPDDKRAREIFVHTDSTYSIGILDKGWKAKANKELIAQIRKTLTSFPSLRFIKVKGHAGIPENERADELATGAVSRGH